MNKKYAKVNVVVGKKQELTKEQQNCDWLVVNIFQDEKDKKIADLEAKLTEREEQLKEEIEEKHSVRRALRACHHQNDEFSDMIKKLVSEKEELKQQLAEKEKLLREKIGSLKTTDFIRLCLDCGFMVDAKDKDNQDKISFALEQLEKVKADINTYNKEHCFLSTEIDTCDKSVEIIDNQIKQLKEGK